MNVIIIFYILNIFFKEFHCEEKSVYYIHIFVYFKNYYLIIIELFILLSDLTNFIKKFDNYVKNKNTLNYKNN